MTDPVTHDSFSPRLPRSLWFGIVLTGLAWQSAVREAFSEEGRRGQRIVVDRRDDSADAERQAREIERLIDGLASSNKAPVQRGRYRGEMFDNEELAEIIVRNERTLETLRETRKPIAAKRTFPTGLK